MSDWRKVGNWVTLSFGSEDAAKRAADALRVKWSHVSVDGAQVKYNDHYAAATYDPGEFNN